MSYLEQRYWITYNGEVFNFIELRRELESLGHRFATDSDTEVILASYAQWGEECVFRFNGMWAFAIWDRERREMFLSRDRFGVKPMRYLSEPRRFCFASELKAFAHLANFSPREDAAEMEHLSTRGGGTMFNTPFQGVKRLPGGYNMIVSAHGVRVWRWWRTIDHLPNVPRRHADQVVGFRELFLDAIRLRLRSDVEVGTCLSGGLDSSSIACSLAVMGPFGERTARDFHRAFVATFDGTSQDEFVYAQAAIDKAGARAHLVPIAPGDVLPHLDQYIQDIELSGTRLLIPLWLTYRALRMKNVVVSLDGHGSDEMLAGYPRHYLNILPRLSILRNPMQRLTLARTLGGILGGMSLRKTADLVVGDFPLRRFLGRVKRWATGSRGPTSPSAATKSSLESYLDEDTLAVIRDLPPFQAEVYKQFHGTVLPPVLRGFDRCSMAHGVEIRMPFLDWRLVTYTMALPMRTLVGRGYSKRVLREAMVGILPEKIRTRRPKLGFQSPMADWFNGALGPWIAHEARTPRFLESDLWDGPAIRDLIDRNNAARSWTDGAATAAWRAVEINLWRQKTFG